MRQVDERGAPPSDTSRRETPRPALSWIALGGALLVGVLLTRSLAAYSLKPLSLPDIGPKGSAPTITTTQQNSGVPGLVLQYIAMASPTAGWASGWKYSNDGTGSQERLFLYWNGETWTETSNLPNSGSITAISALPNGEVWVATGNTIYHLAGGTWEPAYIGENDSSYANVSSIDMLSPTEGWAAGFISDFSGEQGFILRYHDGIWAPQETANVPTSTILRSISMTRDGREGWAVGTLYGGSDLSYALHYLNGTWIQEDAGLPGGTESVSTVSEGDAWAVGITSGTGPGFIAHFNFNAWQRIGSPTPNQLHAITMLSANEGYIAGDGAATLHYINGQWQQEGFVIHQTLLSGIAMTAPGEGWAVGGPVMLREHGGVWSIFPLSL